MHQSKRDGRGRDARGLESQAQEYSFSSSFSRIPRTISKEKVRCVSDWLSQLLLKDVNASQIQREKDPAGHLKERNPFCVNLMSTHIVVYSCRLHSLECESRVYSWERIRRNKSYSLAVETKRITEDMNSWTGLTLDLVLYFERKTRTEISKSFQEK